MRKFELEVNAHLYVNALETFGAVREKTSGESVSPEMIAVVEKIRALRDTSSSFAVTGSIDRPPSEGADLGIWFHRPLHREIAFDAGEGAIDHFELRCSWRRFRATPESGQSWQMPDRWGDCSLLVFAKAGTSFELIEFGPERGDES